MKDDKTKLKLNYGATIFSEIKEKIKDTRTYIEKFSRRTEME